MACLARWWRVEMESDRYVRQRRNGEGQRVREEFCAGRDGDVRSAGEGEGVVGGRVDCRRGGRERTRDVGRRNVEGFGSEGVGEVDADGGAAGGEMEDLTEGGVVEVVRGKGIRRFGNLLRCAPGCDPCLWRGRDGGLGPRAGGEQKQGEERGDFSCNFHGCRVSMVAEVNRFFQAQQAYHLTCQLGAFACVFC